MTETPVNDVLGPEFVQDPYPLYDMLRSERPVTPVIMPSGNRAWLVTKYDDCRAALTEPAICKNLCQLDAPNGPPTEDPNAFLNAHMLNSDPPDHTRLRQLVNKAFTARRVEGLRPRISEICAGLLDRLADADREVDLIAEFAVPLPITVICELIGIPHADQDDFRAWSKVVVASTGTPEEWLATAGAMYLYMTNLFAAKQRAPGDDLLSALLEVQESDGGLSEQELLSMVFLLLITGHETTVNLIGNGMLALLLHPTEQARLRADRSLMPNAIEELLRYDTPVGHATLRYTAEPTAVGGTVIPAGELVMVALGSANRDPARFGSPGDLDIGRETSGHLSFGHGIHYCVGTPLARLEAEIAFGGLLDRFGSITLAVPPSSLRRNSSTLIHGLESLPVRVEA